MVYTKRKVETEKDRFGGYASPYSSFAKTEEETSTENTYNPFASAYSWDTDTDNETETQTEIENVQTEISTETPSYEYESEYIEDIVTDNEPPEYLNPFKQSVFEMQAIERKKVAPKYKINTHGKILCTVYSAICLILVAFAIYNAVAISALASANTAKEAVLSSQKQVISMLESEYNYLGSDEGVSSRLREDEYFENFVEADDTNTVTIYLEAAEGAQTYSVPSNWFDNVCEFFSNLLNG